MNRVALGAVVAVFFSVTGAAQTIRHGWSVRPDATDDVFVMRHFTVATGEGYGTMPRAYAVEARRALSSLAEVGMVGWAGGSDAYLAPEGQPLAALEVTYNALPLLGIKPALGREFTEQDARAGRKLALLTINTWRSRFGSRVDVIATFIANRQNTERVEIVGVLPAGVFTSTPELDPDTEIVTLSPELMSDARGSRNIVAPIVRLRAPITAARAQAALQEAVRAVELSGAAQQGTSLRLESLRRPSR